MLRTRTALSLAVGIGVCALVATVVTWRRPPFADHFGFHPDGRPPWPRWWVDPPLRDQSGATVRVGRRDNAIIVYLPAKPDTYLYSAYPDNRVFDEQGRLLVWDRTEDRIATVENTPDPLAIQDRLLVVDREGAWHQFQVPGGFAENFANASVPRIRGGTSTAVRELGELAEKEGVVTVTVWLNHELGQGSQGEGTSSSPSSQKNRVLTGKQAHDAQGGGA